MSASFEHIENKILQLIAKLDLTKKELLELRQENLELKNQLNVQNEELKNFKNRDKISKIAEGVTGSDEKATRLKHKINEYIREIDKCIASLS